GAHSTDQEDRLFRVAIPATATAVASTSRTTVHRSFTISMVVRSIHGFGEPANADGERRTSGRRTTPVSRRGCCKPRTNGSQRVEQFLSSGGEAALGPAGPAGEFVTRLIRRIAPVDQDTDRDVDQSQVLSGIDIGSDHRVARDRQMLVEQDLPVEAEHFPG